MKLLIIPYHLLTPQHYLFDLVYNPPKTKFLALGEQQGAVIENGYEMLVLQAEENWRIWKIFEIDCRRLEFGFQLLTFVVSHFNFSDSFSFAAQALY